MFNTKEAKLKPISNFTKDESFVAVNEHCGEEWLNELKFISSVEKTTFGHLFKLSLIQSCTTRR